MKLQDKESKIKGTREDENEFFFFALRCINACPLSTSLYYILYGRM
jgi:hypothetical protein